MQTSKMVETTKQPHAFLAVHPQVSQKVANSKATFCFRRGSSKATFGKQEEVLLAVDRSMLKVSSKDPQGQLKAPEMKGGH